FMGCNLTEGTGQHAKPLFAADVGRARELCAPVWQKVPAIHCLGVAEGVARAPGCRYFPPPTFPEKVMEFDRDFGINQVFVEDQYERWRDNPQAVDEAWQRYFAQLAGLPVPQARTAVLQTSALSQPPVPVRGNGNGNGPGPAVQA